LSRKDQAPDSRVYYLYGLILAKNSLLLMELGGEGKSFPRSLDLDYWHAIAGLYLTESRAGIILRTNSHCGNFLWINEVFHSIHLLSSVKIISKIQFQSMLAKSYSSNFKYLKRG